MTFTDNEISDLIRYVENGCIYIGEPGKDRYALGEPGEKTALFLGINPSNAKYNISTGGIEEDRTVHKVKTVISRKDVPYDGWIAINLYPQVTPYTKYIHKDPDIEMIENNHRVIEAIVDQFSPVAVWAAWGASIDNLGKRRREWLEEECGWMISTMGRKMPWKCFGGVTKAGHPRHPLYVSIDKADFTDWIIGGAYERGTKD